MRLRNIAVIAFDGISPFHLAVPCAVFGEDRRAAGVPRFRLIVCSAEHRQLQSSAGFAIATRYGLKDLVKVDTIIVPSWRETSEDPPQELLDALRAAHRRGIRIVALCLGAFVLAAAGLLDGRVATTHWAFADELRRRYPKVKVNPNVLYHDDGDILTSAGTAAGIDCCLHLLRSAYGAEIANIVARRLVVQPHRQGGQAQYVEQPVAPSADDARLAKVLDWVTRNLKQAHSLDSLAGRALMSRRTFTRRFRRATGTTVGKWIRHQRLVHAQRLLERTNRTIDAVAQVSGFGTPASLRAHFIREFRVSPSGYRNTFRGA